MWETRSRMLYCKIKHCRQLNTRRNPRCFAYISGLKNWQDSAIFTSKRKITHFSERAKKRVLCGWKRNLLPHFPPTQNTVSVMVLSFLPHWFISSLLSPPPLPPSAPPPSLLSQKRDFFCSWGCWGVGRWRKGVLHSRKCFHRNFQGKRKEKERD